MHSVSLTACVSLPHSITAGIRQSLVFTMFKRARGADEKNESLAEEIKLKSKPPLSRHKDERRISCEE